MLFSVPFIAEAAAAFAATNVDDFVLLVALFVTLGRNARSVRRIWFGQFLGIAVLTVLSIVIALGLSGIPLTWVGLLGLAPLGIGLYALLRPKHAPGGNPSPFGGTIASVAVMTVANGADNVTAYVPLFRAMVPAETVGTAFVFSVMTALWCLAARWVSRRPTAERLTRRTAPRVVPFLYIAVGLVILARSAFEALS